MSMTMSRPLQLVAPRQQGGIALIEALVAILIFSIGVLGLVGLQSLSTHSTTMAKSRIDASLVCNQRIAEIWGDIAHIDSYAEADADVSAWLPPNGKRTTEISGTSAPYTVTVTVTWDMPSEPGQTYTTIAMVSTK